MLDVQRRSKQIPVQYKTVGEVAVKPLSVLGSAVQIMIPAKRRRSTRAARVTSQALQVDILLETLWELEESKDMMNNVASEYFPRTGTAQNQNGLRRQINKI